MIQLLDQYTIDKIAAGEVIERPGSVIKELVENAIDADASAVTVEIRDGGLSFIRITDNGCGIAAAEVPMAFLRHATSKLTSAEDLLKVASLGFRGEALSSIAAVAQVELITKQKEAVAGTRYQIHGGKEISMEEIGAPDGTTIVVRNLFYNTPARKKYMKTPATEGSYIYDLMCRMAMSHPEVSFQFMMNGAVKLSTSGNGRLKEIIYHIYGRDITNNLLEIDEANDQVRITGYLAKPSISRGNRSFEDYYVNHRYIKSQVLTKAIEDAYRTFVMIHKFPFTVINFDIDPALIDVNIHPAKRELKFVREPEMYDFTYISVRKALLFKELIPTVTTGKDARPETLSDRNYQKQPEPFETKRREENMTGADIKKELRSEREDASQKEAEIMQAAAKTAAEQMQADITQAAAGEEQSAQFKYSAAPTAERSVRTDAAWSPAENPQQTEAGTKNTQMNLFEDKFISAEARKKHRLIGQLFKTYWLIEYGDKFFIMDQHAAHEKVKFEELMRNYKNKMAIPQYLMPPAIVTLSGAEAEFLRGHLSFFTDLGFQIEGFGGKEYKLSAVPGNLFGLDGRELFLDFIGELSENGQKTTIDVFISRLSGMACKAAIKGNTEISFKEADALIDQLLQLENPYTCPHGRPTLICMTETELEKKFKRIV